MKKTLLTLSAIVAFVTMNAQNCTPDGTYTAAGVYPDSATNLAVAYVGVPYAQTITAVTPADSCVVILFPPCTTVPIDSVMMQSVTGMPSGLSIVSMNENSLPFKFPGGSTSCMLISGIPTTAGHYPIQVHGTTYATVFTLTQTQPFDVNYYFIDVIDLTAVNELKSEKFSVAQNSPNPFSHNSTIDYVLPSDGKMTIEIRNVIGEIVLKDSKYASKGKNTYHLNASNLTNGVYFYQFSFDEHVVTKRFIINK